MEPQREESNQFNPKVTHFKGVRSMITPISLNTALDHIQCGVYKSTIEAVRAELDKAKRSELKKKLHAVTFSGLFDKKRITENLKEYSNIVCHDIDGLQPEEIARLRDELKQDKYVYSFFLSPSGNGFKILFRTATTPQDHTKCFNALGSYLVNNYSIVFDEKCKDITRLCFMSYDPEMYLNVDSEVINSDFISEWIPTETAREWTSNDYLDKCHEITKRTQKAMPGHFNQYNCVFALQANRYGISEIECISHLQSYCADHEPQETAKEVKSVYKSKAGEHGDYLKNSKFTPAHRTVQKNINQHSSIAIDSEEVNTSILFWYTVKNKQDKEKLDYRFSYDDAIGFLHNNGFYKYPLDNGFYQFIHINKKKRTVKVVTQLQIKEFMINFLKVFEEEDNIKAVREMFRRGAKNYCSINLLEGLDYLKPTFKKDTKDKAFVYFKNCFLEVSKDGIKPIDYKLMTGYIWDKQVKDIDYKKTEKKGDFEYFILHAISSKSLEGDDKLEDEDIDKIASVKTTIGYLLHRYKNPAVTKAVISVDKVLRKTGEQNGRSGKSLFGKGLRQMLNVCLLDGRNFKFDSPFPFQTANIDTELIDFNDVPKNFDFSRLFGMITEEFTFDKKGKDSIVMPFSEAPKFYISTNYTLKGDGESMKGRQQIMEFSNFFNSERTPLKKFGKMFFYEWEEIDFLQFYNFMIDCIQNYLEAGLVPFPLAHYEENKLIDSAGEEFIDFMNESILDLITVNGKIIADKEVENKALYKDFIDKNQHRSKTHIKTFNKNVKAWAMINNLDINAHKSGGRDRRNGTDFSTFSIKK